MAETYGRDRGLKTPLRVLVIEDAADDAAMIVRELERGGYDVCHERVETPEAMREALKDGRWDVVVADHAMPQFSAPAALGVLRERNLDLPFIVVSGKMGEQEAAAAVRTGGGHDYTMKGNLGRLSPAVERELHEAAERRERRRNEAALSQSEKVYRTVVEDAFECIFLVDAASKRVLEANTAFRELLGYTSEELEELTLYDFVEHDPESVNLNVRRILKNERYTVGERRYRRKDGSVATVEVRANTLLLGGREVICYVSHDITDRKRVEEELRRRNAILEAVRFATEHFLSTTASWEESIEEVLERLGEATGACRVYISENRIGEDGEVWGSQRHEWVATDVSAQMDNTLMMQAIPYRAAGYGRWVELWDRGEIVYGHTREFPETERPELQAQDIVSVAIVPIFVEGRWWGQIGFDERVEEREWSAAEMDALKAAAGTLGATIQRQRIEEELREGHALLRSLVEGMTDPIFVKDAHGRYLMVNSPYARVLGRPEEEIIGKDDAEILPPVAVRRLMESDRQVMDSGQTHELEEEVPVGDETRTFLSTKLVYRGHQGKPAGIIGVAHDITERKRAEERMREIQEAERRRIAADMHDDVLQDLLYGLQETQIMRLNTTFAYEARDSGPNTDLEEIIDALSRSVVGLRSAIFELRLEETLERSLASSVESLVGLNRRMSRQRCEVHLTVEDGFPQFFPTETGKNLLRIVQEALNNARRHSDARNIWVGLRTDGNDVYAEVADDGRGFDAESARDGVGTSLMRQRALNLGGELEIQSAPGAGTAVRFRGPTGHLGCWSE